MAVDKNWYWTVSSQKEVTKLLDWLKAQGERIDNSFGHTDTWCYISYDVLRGEWHLVKSCDVLYSNKSFQSLLPWESEESKFIVGKWYCNSEKTYAKVDSIIDDTTFFSYKECINNGFYEEYSSFWGDHPRMREASLVEIHQYLPDGHPDKIGDKKIEELTEFPLLGFCKTKSSELKAYLENKFPAQEKTSKWDDDNYKLIAWNYTAYWLCKEKSDRPEYTIEQLQKFFNKKSITEKLLEEAKLKYPVGTKIQKCLDGWSEDGETNIISGIPYNTVSGLIWVKGSKHDLCIYHNGRWAEIISLPEPEIETPNVEKIIDFQKQGRPIMDCSGSTTGVIVKNPTSNFSKQIDKTPEFLMLDSEVVEFQALPKRKPVSIQLIGID